MARHELAILRERSEQKWALGIQGSPRSGDSKQEGEAKVGFWGSNARRELLILKQRVKKSGLWVFRACCELAILSERGEQKWTLGPIGVQGSPRTGNSEAEG